MARLTDEIFAGWRALDRASSGEGWRTIRVGEGLPLALMAARHFPESAEALLVGFGGIRLPSSERLPDATGFAVTRVDTSDDKSSLWLALVRRQAGRQDLFAAMVADVVTALTGRDEASPGELLQVFLRRVRAWQAFMRKGDSPLGPESEAGLVGELCFLELLLDSGIAPDTAVLAWTGPFDTPQDFTLGTGAVEVKATVARTGFPAKISSLEQLDDSVLSPLFVAAQRLIVSEAGLRLPDWVALLSSRLASETSVTLLFQERLVAAGYSDIHAGHYTRRFLKGERQLHHVDDTFPRLVPGAVPPGIRRATYEIDIDQAGRTTLTPEDVLTKLGAA